jgi:DNA-binding transcriptional ArsR family regulator
MKSNQLSLNQKKVMQFLAKQPHVTTHDIVFALRIPRPTAKQVLTRLVQLHLLERNGLGRGAYYTLKQQDVVMDSYGNELVTVYRGVDGFRRMFRDIAKSLQKKDYYWSFAFKDEYYGSEAIAILLDFHKELARKGVEDRSIAHASVRNLINKTYKGIPNLKIRFTHQDIPTGMSILGDSVINLVWGESPVAIVVKSPEIYKRYQAFFESLWKQ